MSRYQKHYLTLLNNQSVSYWLKDALKSADKRDICDALADAEALLGALQAKYAEVVS